MKKEIVKSIIVTTFGKDYYNVYDGTETIQNTNYKSNLEVKVLDTNYYIPFVGQINKNDFTEIKKDGEIKDDRIIKKIIEKIK